MRGEKFLRLVVIVLCCVVASYIVFSVIRSPDSDYTTYKAVYYEVGGFSTSGFVVRSEIQVTGGRGTIVVAVRSEGERVGKGQTVATTFLDNEAKLRQNQIDELETELSQLEYAYTFATAGMDASILDSDIVQLMDLVTVSTYRRDFEAADEAAEELKPVVLRRYVTSADSDTLWERITADRNSLNELYAQSSGSTGTITAQEAGYFSSAVDGYESVLNPELLETATVSQFLALEPAPVPDDAIGRLVTSPKWYYATVVDTGLLTGVEVGDRITVNFSVDFYQSVTMKVERISPSENGKCLLVLSSEKYVQDAVSTRAQTANLILEHSSGLLVPKSAIYVNDRGERGVYVLEGAEAHWKTVDILSDTGESFLVALDQSSIDNLWPEDEIILTKEEMFEGKVMVR